MDVDGSDFPFAVCDETVVQITTDSDTLFALTASGIYRLDMRETKPWRRLPPINAHTVALVEETRG